MPDGAFAAEVAEAADCGILLDLHNLLCNERNGRQSVAEFCNSIPLERVWEIHLAGGEAAGGFWVDAHSGLVEPALMEIVASIVPQLPALRAIIFEIIPDYIAAVGLAPIGTMLGELNDLWLAHASNGCRALDRSDAIEPAELADMVTPDMWEMALGAAVTETAIPELPAEFADWVRSAEIPLGLYRTYSRETRASSLVELCAADNPLTSAASGGGSHTCIARGFLAPGDPRLFDHRRCLDVPGLCQRCGSLDSGPG